jgi:hypothetical protein
MNKELDKDMYVPIYNIIADIATESYDDGWCNSNADKPHDGPNYDEVATKTITIIKLLKSNIEAFSAESYKQGYIDGSIEQVNNHIGIGVKNIESKL